MQLTELASCCSCVSHMWELLSAPVPLRRTPLHTDFKPSVWLGESFPSSKCSWIVFFFLRSLSPASFYGLSSELEELGRRTHSFLRLLFRLLFAILSLLRITSATLS